MANQLIVLMSDKTIKTLDNAHAISADPDSNRFQVTDTKGNLIADFPNNKVESWGFKK